MLQEYAYGTEDVGVVLEYRRSTHKCLMVLTIVSLPGRMTVSKNVVRRISGVGLDLGFGNGVVEPKDLVFGSARWENQIWFVGKWPDVEDGKRLLSVPFIYPNDIR